eukprot:scaffold44483_cov191-Amphora_coffeaeformis.AAC.1
MAGHRTVRPCARVIDVPFRPDTWPSMFVGAYRILRAFGWLVRDNCTDTPCAGATIPSYRVRGSSSDRPRPIIE